MKKVEDALSLLDDCIRMHSGGACTELSRSLKIDNDPNNLFMHITVAASKKDIAHWPMNVDLIEKAFCIENPNYSLIVLESLDSVVDTIKEKYEFLGCTFLKEEFKFSVSKDNVIFIIALKVV